MKNASLFFDELLDAKVREFNPRYAEVAAGGALLGLCLCLPSSTASNRGFPFISNTLN
jgi:type I restriction enzyme R subunit